MTNYDILKEYEAHKTPVPSYEEWQQLKELLKECKERLIYCTISTHDVQTKIDEALR